MYSTMRQENELEAIIILQFVHTGRGAVRQPH